MAQYKQRVDESVYVVSAQLVPGLRGRALRIAAYEYPMAESTLGGFAQINDGHQFQYIPPRIKTLAPVQPVQNITVNGRFAAKAPSPYTFKARQIAEINVRRAQ